MTTRGVSVRKEQSRLVESLRAEGRSRVEIATVVGQRFKVNPRVAFRLAHGWTQQQAADAWCQRWPDNPKTFKAISRWEVWPAPSGHAPPFEVLNRLAKLYQCTVSDLVADQADYRHLDPANRSQSRPARALAGAAAPRRAEWGGHVVAIAGVDGSVAALPWLDLDTPIEPTPAPAKIDRSSIAQVRLAAATFLSWDNSHGGGLAREAIFAQLRWCAQLLYADCPDPLRPDLFAAVAELGGVAGFMAFDAYAHADARRTFGFSLKCAEESLNWHLRASILSMLARQAIWCGQPDDGLTYVETALVRSDRLTATERASLHTLRARALAKLRRPQDTLTAVGAADAAFAHANPADDPPRMAYYDHAQHHGDTGHALWDLSIAGRRTQATPRLAYSVAHHTAEYARSRTISRIKLASLAMITGDPREAAAVGNVALDDIGRLRSRRAIDDLRELHRFADRHPGIGEATELRDRIIETLDAQ